MPSTHEPTVFRGARIICPEGRWQAEDTVFVVRNGTFDYIGPPTHLGEGLQCVDLTGTTVIPALIGAHGHIGYMRNGTTRREHYTALNVLDHQRRLTYHGISTFLSLGTDRSCSVENPEGGLPPNHSYTGKSSQDAVMTMLLTAGSGFVATTPGEANGGPYFATDVLTEVNTPDEARRAIKRVAATSPQVIKLWVDDRGGKKRKLDAPTIQAIVEGAHVHGLRTVAHIHDLEDAKTAVKAGVDALAHLVRSPGPDQELLDLMGDRGVAGFSSLSVQRGTLKGADWLSDPLLAETTTEVARMNVLREIDAMERRYPGSFASDVYTVMESCLRTYMHHGVDIVLSSDAGLLGGFMGYAEHRELESLTDAGMSPLEAIRTATVNAARFLRLPERGGISAGKRADFIVLEADPRSDIRNTRSIRDVYLSGIRTDRGCLRREIDAFAAVS